ncbi:R3H and coiled-coil domain-containing protein [Dirofilaria immitis]
MLVSQCITDIKRPILLPIIDLSMPFAGKSAIFKRTIWQNIGAISVSAFSLSRMGQRRTVACGRELNRPEEDGLKKKESTTTIIEQFWRKKISR